MSTRLLTRKKEQTNKKRSKLKLALILLVPVVLAFAWVLKFSGRYLVAQNKLKESSYALVLEGQGRNMYRTDFGAKLLKDGLVDTLVVSGVRAFKDSYLSDFYIAKMLEEGADKNRIVSLHHDAYSTLHEAMLLVPFFKELDEDTVLLVTSSYHSARAQRIFNAVSKGKPYFLAIDIGDPLYHQENWIYNRESRKIWFYEVSKNILALLELYHLKVNEKAKPDWNNWILASKLENKQAVPAQEVNCPLIPKDTIPTDTLREIEVSP